jgi:hypothetical protein
MACKQGVKWGFLSQKAERHERHERHPRVLVCGGMANMDYKKVRNAECKNNRGGAEARRVRKGDLAQGEEQWEQAESAEGASARTDRDDHSEVVMKGTAPLSPLKHSRSEGGGSVAQGLDRRVSFGSARVQAREFAAVKAGQGGALELRRGLRGFKVI